MPKRVLVADDNPVIRKLLCRLLEEQATYEICAEAANGADAIELAKRELPDLIILDASMPVMNGIAAARALKKLFPHVPIILFTQHADVARQLSDLPVDRVVSKNDSASLDQRNHCGVPMNARRIGWQDMRSANHRAAQRAALAAIIVAALSVMFAPPAAAQSPSKFEVGGDYNFVRANAPPGGCGCINMNGGDGWLSYNVRPSWALVGQTRRAARREHRRLGRSGSDLHLIFSRTTL